MAKYIAVIHKDDTSEYSVSFPDFPGCVTAGETVDEAKDMAQEALELHVEGMGEDGEALPAPTTLDAIVQSPDGKDATAFFVVEIKGETDKAIRFNATMSAGLLERLDRTAKSMNLTRSAFLARAVEHELHNDR